MIYSKLRALRYVASKITANRQLEICSRTCADNKKRLPIEHPAKVARFARDQLGGHRLLHGSIECILSGDMPLILRQHREYSIEQRNGKYVAKPLDGDKLKIYSSYLPRVLAAIDTLWHGLSQVPAVAPDEIVGPRWVREWLARPTDIIDVDDAYRRGAC